MEKIWIVSHERFRNDSESYDVLAAFETKEEASAVMKQYGHDIRKNEYNKIPYYYTTSSIMFRIKENDISCIIAQEDILRVIPVEIKKFDFKQNKILKYINNVK